MLLRRHKYVHVFSHNTCTLYYLKIQILSYNHVNKNTRTTFKNPLLQNHWAERFGPRASWGVYSTGRASPYHNIFHLLFQCVESCSQIEGGWGVRPPWKVSSFRKHPLLYNPVDISSKWFIKKVTFDSLMKYYYPTLSSHTHASVPLIMFYEFYSEI